MDTLILSEREVEGLIDLRELLDALEVGFCQLSAGEVQAPGRNELAMPHDAFLLGMPGHRPGGEMTVKLVTVFEQNLELGIPSHLALICMFDPRTGVCTTVMDGTYITAVRTAASAAVSTRHLAREDARVLTIVGAGVQGRSHLRTLPLTRDFEEIRIGSKRFADAEHLASQHPRAHPISDFEAAVSTSDVVALATHAAEPVISPTWIRPGTHVTSVGYRPPRGELPPALLDTATLFVETRESAFQPPPVGCAELQDRDPATATELGELLAGNRPGRVATDQITVYKAMGHVMEDIVAADLARHAALDRGVGHRVEISSAGGAA